jgi:phosphate transport system permease protein
VSAPSLTTARAQHRAAGVAFTQSRRRPGETLFRLTLQACLLIAFAALTALLIWVLVKGWSRLDSRLWTQMPTGLVSRLDGAGVQSALVGTLWIISLVAVISQPIGILSAIYLEEYADTTRWYNGCSNSTSRTSPVCRRSSMVCWALRFSCGTSRPSRRGARCCRAR